MGMLNAEAESAPNPTVDFPDRHGDEAPVLDIEELFDADGRIDAAECPDDPDGGTWDTSPGLPFSGLPRIQYIRGRCLSQPASEMSPSTTRPASPGGCRV
jgi:hypothetical protein